MLANPFFDWLMPLFDDPSNWIPIIIIFWLSICYLDKDNRWLLIILVPLVILFADQTGAFIKSFGLRDRPWFSLGTEAVRHLGGTGGKHASFPSNHAANISGISFLFSSLYPKFKAIFWSGAGIVMFSRVYIGVHYPLDVVVGCILGTLISFITISIWRKFNTYEQTV